MFPAEARAGRGTITGPVDTNIFRRVKMSRTTLIAAVMLALVALAHLVRFLFKVEATIGGVAVPMWVSVLATVVAGGVALQLWREGRTR